MKALQEPDRLLRLDEQQATKHMGNAVQQGRAA